MSPNAGGGVAGSQSKSTAVQCPHGAQINFGDLTPYLTHDLHTLNSCTPTDSDIAMRRGPGGSP
jgi:hypothetical protein